MTLVRSLVCLTVAVLTCCLPLVGSPAADRGIGGTGAPASEPVISDRGIGGTGIVGVVTGFGSVFVNGLEVAYSPSTPLTVDGVAEPGAALRVGQVATIVASDDHGLHAVSIDVRHEVSGPVTSVSAGGDPGRLILVVAGQQVAVDSATEGLQESGRLQAVRQGDWVAVSGLREPGGIIAASRIDSRSPGPVLVRGTTMPEAGGWRIGDLPVQPPNGVSMESGATFTARGTLADGRLAVATADPDVLSANPAAYFGNHVQRMVIESYVSAADGQVRLGGGLLAAPGRGVAVQAGQHRVIVQLERGAQGDFVATHLRPIAPRRVPFAPERHGFFGPPHAGPFRFGPPRIRPHAWEGRRMGFGHGWARGRGWGRGSGHGWGRGPRMR